MPQPTHQGERLVVLTKITDSLCCQYAIYGLLNERRKACPPNGSGLRRKCTKSSTIRLSRGDKRLVPILPKFPPQFLEPLSQGIHPARQATLNDHPSGEELGKGSGVWVARRRFLGQQPTEQVIGEMKRRARTVRGYKHWSGIASGVMVAGVRVA